MGQRMFLTGNLTVLISTTTIMMNTHTGCPLKRTPTTVLEPALDIIFLLSGIFTNFSPKVTRLFHSPAPVLLPSATTFVQQEFMRQHSGLSSRPLILILTGYRGGPAQHLMMIICGG